MMRPPSVMYRLYQESISFFLRKKKLFKDEHKKIAEIESSLIPQQFKNVCLLCVCVCVHIE